MRPTTSAPAPLRSRLTDRVGRWLNRVRRDEHHLALFLSLVIGALVGLVIVAFILLTGRLAAGCTPPAARPGAAFWCRSSGPHRRLLLFRFFPQARGSGIPQTKPALFIEDGSSRCAP